MGRNKKFNRKEKNRVIKLKALEVSMGEIAKDIQRSKTGVFNCVNKNQDEIETIRNTFIAKMREMGINDERLIKELERLAFESTKLHGPKDGMIKVADNQVRIKAIQVLKDIMGLDAPRKQQIKEEITEESNAPFDYGELRKQSPLGKKKDNSKEIDRNSSSPQAEEQDREP